MARFSLTFKENEKEKKMYQFLKSKFAPGNYIKELIWADMNKENENKTSIATTITEPVEDIEDPANNFSFANFNENENKEE